ncbi:unnamed protein product [Trichogramma brassicae]|uniref:Uncharacterized protein n=1 Tax=Trichogramma brassicae TaxID=86971 RepID=A0A6H5HWE2_9HYME|nr:unnamed protein product [Trichogramma brassicae]
MPAKTSHELNRSRDTHSAEPYSYKPPSGRGAKEITMPKHLNIDILPPRLQAKYIREHGPQSVSHRNNSIANQEEPWDGSTVTFKGSASHPTSTPHSENWSNSQPIHPARGRGRGRYKLGEISNSLLRPGTPDQSSGPSSRSDTPNQEYTNRSYDRRGSSSTVYTSTENLNRDSSLMPPPSSLPCSYRSIGNRCQSPNSSLRQTTPSSSLPNNTHQTSSQSQNMEENWRTAKTSICESDDGRRTPLSSSTSISNSGSSSLQYQSSLQGTSSFSRQQQPKRTLFDPNNPNKPIVVTSPGSRAASQLRENDTAIKTPSILTSIPGTQSMTQHGFHSTIADKPPFIQVPPTDQLNNMKPSWYDPCSERKRREERELKEKSRMLEKESSNHKGLRREIWYHPDGKRVRRTTSTVSEMKNDDESDLDTLEQLSSLEELLSRRNCCSSNRNLTYTVYTYALYTLETFQEAAIQMLREFRSLLHHVPLPLPISRLLQLLALNMFAIDSTQLKAIINRYCEGNLKNYLNYFYAFTDTEIEKSYRSEVQERALIMSLQMFSLILERVSTRLLRLKVKLVKLPEDTTLAGFTPLMSIPQDPFYADKKEDINDTDLLVESFSEDEDEDDSSLKVSKLPASGDGLTVVVGGKPTKDHQRQRVQLRRCSAWNLMSTKKNSLRAVESPFFYPIYKLSTTIYIASSLQQNCEDRHRCENIHRRLRCNTSMLSSCSNDRAPDSRTRVRAFLSRDPTVTRQCAILLNELEGLTKGIDMQNHATLARFAQSPEHIAMVAANSHAALTFIRSKNPAVKCVTTRGTILASSSFTVEEDGCQLEMEGRGERSSRERDKPKSRTLQRRAKLLPRTALLHNGNTFLLNVLQIASDSSLRTYMPVHITTPTCKEHVEIASTAASDQ